MRERHVGLALGLVAALVFVATVAFSPFPTTSDALGRKMSGAGAAESDRVVIASHEAFPHSYDAVNDTTLLYVSVCNHSLCGPLVMMKGDHRNGVDGPMLLVPTDSTLSLQPAPARDDDLTQGYRPSRHDAFAFSSTFEVRSPWPVFLVRLSALALVAGGLAMAATQRTWGAFAAFGALPALSVTKSASYIILIQILGMPAFFIAGVTAVSVLIVRRRVGVAAMLAIAFALVLASGFVAFAHFAPDGGD